MEYLREILWLVSWPVCIFVTYKLAVFAIKKYEKKLGEEN